MKATLCILPVIAVAMVTGWIGSRKAAVARVERDVFLLREKVDQANRALDSEVVSRSNSDGDSDGRINWRRVADRMQAAESGAADMRSMIRLRKLLLEMSSEEILEALDEICALGLGKRGEERLELMLVGLLVEREPAMCLIEFSGRLNAGGFEFALQFSNAFREWLIQDSEAAMRWYGIELDKGGFDSRSLDGRSEAYTEFEATLNAHLVAMDSEALLQRMKKSPEGERQTFLSNWRIQNDPRKRLLALKISREHLSETEHRSFISSQASAIGDREGLLGVGGFLEEIDASEPEREAAVASVAMRALIGGVSYGHFPPEDNSMPFSAARLRKVHSWIGEQAPRSSGDVTGQLLAGFNSSRFMGGVVDILKILSEETGDDRMIVSFLENNGHKGDVTLAMDLGSRVDDAELRSQLMEYLGLEKETDPLQNSDQGGAQ